MFTFFAVFPEDVPVPVDFFNALAPLISGVVQSVKARLEVGGCLSTLVKFNLLKGSMAGGLFMHDIVRDYVVKQHSRAELQALQHSVVEAALAARPQPDGFDDCAVADTFDGYGLKFLDGKNFLGGPALKDEEDAINQPGSASCWHW